MADDLDRLTTALAERYTIERELGSGGMATVYLAQDLKHDRQVALKVLKPELAHAVGADRFLREIRITAGLNHPHILPLLDSGEADGFLYFVMPYVASESLRDRLDREGPLPIDEALRIAEQVASALEHAHRQEVIHRDIKPENILLHEGEAMVADFGIAVAVSAAGGERLTETGIAVGTPAFMSPEQAAGEAEIDERSDIYSLGCVLYEMVGGEVPHGGATPREILAQKVLRGARSIRELRPEADEALEAVLARALEPAPEDRFATAGELGEALRSPEVGWTIAAKRLRTRRRKVVAATTAGVVLLVVAFGVIWQIVKSQSAPRMLAVLPFEYQGAVEYELRANGVIDEIITRLGKIGGVQLQALQSAKRYRDSDKRPGEIGVELGVDYLLGGTIGWDETGQDDGRVRIVPELIRVADEAQLWMQPYDTAYAAAILDLPAEVAERVAQALAVGLGGAEREAVRARPTESVEAHILWLQGNNELGKMTVPAFQQALEYYQGAIAISPTYARAHAGMAMALIELGGWWSSLEPGVVRSQARTAALAALEYDSTLAEAHMALGRIKALFDWDWAGADSSFRRGIELNPSATHARIIYANYLIMMGRFEEALAIGRQALEGDPFSQPAHRHVGWALDRLGRDAEALEHYQRALELAPNLFPPHLRLVEFYLRRGLLEEASRYVEQAEKLPAVAQVPIAMGHLGYYYARLDRRADALRVLEELEERAEREFVNPGGVALVYLGLGQIEKFLELEEQSFQVRTLSLVALKVRWLYDPLRDDPRFQDLLRRMNFPD